MSRNRKVLYHLTVLFMLYLNIILSFSVIYMVLDHMDIGPIVDHYRGHLRAKAWFDPLIKPLYFSAITLLSVGYGDITPFGWSRVVSVLEAMIGYLLPATLAVQVAKFIPNLFGSNDHDKTEK
ncbi:MAG TPA: potassium channel family protein [Bacillales bacterium]|nr:potassium channel family protein [Bacillales bacterium]